MKTQTLWIDGRAYQVEGDGKNLLSVCLTLGFDLPYFCWHPALHSVGACRQCAVKLYRDEKDTRGRITMSCMTPVTEGMRLSIADEDARAFRAGVIEWLMVNHPHDCPICDEGSECHLQDMTVMTGHTYRRYHFTKRTHRNQNLGPFLNHEMNRCIQCYRCVRFYRDYAGGRDLEVLGWHDSVYFGRHRDGPLENEFSGNLVEVCPTGVFTDKTQIPHYSRKWDLQSAPSLCVHCAVGCNTIPGERLGVLRRIRTRYNHEVNGYFLCDRGRYGYEFVNAESRLRSVLLRDPTGLRESAPEAALERVRTALGGRLIGIGSPRASLETNFALRELVGPESFYAGLPQEELELWRLMVSVLESSPAPSASVHRASLSDAVLVLGEDVWNTAPVLALAIRQAALNRPVAEAMRTKRLQRWDDSAIRSAIQGQKGPLFIAAAAAGELDSVAIHAQRASPEEAARLGFAVAHEIDPACPAPDRLSPEIRQLAARIAVALIQADRPLVVSGSSMGVASLIQAAANVSRALKRVGRDAALSLVFPEAGSFGLAVLAERGLEAAERSLEERETTVVAAEVDLLRNGPREVADRLLRRAAHLIVLDHTRTETVDRAEIVLPVTPFAEGSGTHVSSEGRAQRFFAVYPPKDPVNDAWRWLGRLSAMRGRQSTPWENLDEIVAACATAIPRLRGMAQAAPGAGFRVDGQRIARQPHRLTGRTAVNAHLDIHEPTPPKDPDSPLAFSMEGKQASPSLALIPRFWWPRWNSDQSLNKFQIEIGGPLRGGDPGVRLVEPAETEQGGYYAASAAGTRLEAGIRLEAAARQETTASLLLVPLYHVFGTEELSLRAAGIAQRAPQPYVALSAADAARLGLSAGQAARVHVQRDAAAEQIYVLPVVIKDLAAGVAGLPRGLPGLPSFQPPARARIEGGGR